MGGRAAFKLGTPVANWRIGSAAMAEVGLFLSGRDVEQWTRPNKVILGLLLNHRTSHSFF